MLPLYQTDIKELSLLQTNWKSQLDTVLKNPFLKGILLDDVVLVTGSNVINHRLGRALQGWVITGINAAAQIYDTQSTNNMPQLTLNLTSDADVTISLYVF